MPATFIQSLSCPTPIGEMIMSKQPLILLTEPIAEAGLAILRDVGTVQIAGTTDPYELTDKLARADALIVRSSRVTGDMLKASPRLKVVGRHGAGVETIDTATAQQLGIEVVSTPGANAESVAEFTILAALNMSRNIQLAVRLLASGAFPPGRSLPSAVVQYGLTGTMLRGRTLGVIGLGAIGREVARLGQELGMAVVAHDPVAAETPPGIKRLPLELLLEQSDIVTVHVPHTRETTGLIGARELARMPHGSLLINTARAAVVEPRAVLAALDEGTLSGYAVDVFEPEPPAPDDPLLAHPRVFATPHMAAMTTHSLHAMAVAVAQGVAAILASTPDP